MTAHDRGVEFDLAFVSEYGAPACIKQGKIFQRANRRLNGVERTSSAFENIPSREQPVFQSDTVLRFERWRHSRF